MSTTHKLSDPQIDSQLRDHLRQLSLKVSRIVMVVNVVTLLSALIAMPILEITGASSGEKKVSVYLYLMHGPTSIVSCIIYFFARRNIALIELFAPMLQLCFVIMVYLVNLEVIPWEQTTTTRNY